MEQDLPNLFSKSAEKQKWQNHSRPLISVCLVMSHSTYRCLICITQMYQLFIFRIWRLKIRVLRTGKWLSNLVVKQQSVALDFNATSPYLNTSHAIFLVHLMSFQRLYSENVNNRGVGATGSSVTWVRKPMLYCSTVIQNVLSRSPFHHWEEILGPRQLI